MTVFNSMVFRLINILINRTDFNKELGIIKEITKFNGYDVTYDFKISTNANIN